MLIHVVAGEEKLREKRAQLAGGHGRGRDAAPFHDDFVAVVEVIELLRVVADLELKFTDDAEVRSASGSRAQGWCSTSNDDWEELLLDAIYTLPSQKRIKEFVITSEMVERRRAIPGEGLTGVDGAAA